MSFSYNEEYILYNEQKKKFIISLLIFLFSKKWLIQNSIVNSILTSFFSRFERQWAPGSVFLRELKRQRYERKYNGISKKRTFSERSSHSSYSSEEIICI